jgi:peptidoglycan/xylan/chitin deacetylase (PgdA/CDA1 family)
MRPVPSGGAAVAQRAALRQLIVGLVALPLSVLPFLAYCWLTPEGRLVRDKAIVAISPPRLPALTPDKEREAAAIVPRYEGRVMALVYHGIGSAGDTDGGFVVSPARFGEHLATLRAAGMHVVTAADVAWSFALGQPLPDRAVMISFDDGRSDAMLFADPLLEQAGMKATMFVISEAAAKPGLYYAGWNRLRAAARSGRWDIEAHSDGSHHMQRVAGGASLPALTSLSPGESLDAYRTRVHDDLERNSAAILAHVGQRPVAFAYPFGAYGAARTNDAGIEAILRDEVASRFVLAFHQDDQDTLPLVDPSQSRVGLRRLSVGDWSGTALLQRIARAAGSGDDGSPDPVAVSDPVVKTLPPIPFVSELRARTPVEAAGPGPAQNAQPAATSSSTTSTTQPATTSTTAPSPVAPIPPTTRPPTPSSTTTTTVTTATSTTTTTRPPTTTTTKPAPTTTTSTAPTTTTTTRCRSNGRKCWP